MKRTTTLAANGVRVTIEFNSKGSALMRDEVDRVVDTLADEIAQAMTKVPYVAPYLTTIRRR